ncbi:MAG: trypsin-like peptidase domain-containing protein [Pirellulaceae bacterium]|nr:trypsin-like peptidase domain-containing protein [Pirellulaceae bacterium]
MLIAVIAIVYLAAAGGRHTRGVAQGGARPASSGSPVKTAKGMGLVEFELADADRASISLHVDGRKHPIPSSGAVRVEVPAGNRQLVLQRRGFEQQNVQMVVKAGDRIVYQPKWAPLMVPEGGFGVSLAAAPLAPAQAAVATQDDWDGWQQDYELARTRAASSRKDILLLFTGSDWSQASQQLARNVLLAEQFPQQVRSRYELVLVDFPRTVAQRRKVANPAGNVQLKQDFGVQGFPSLVLVDEAGLPYARLQYQNGDFNDFMRILEACRTFRVDRDDLFARVTASSGEAKLEALAQASQMLEEMDVRSHYVPMFRKWYQEARQADPRNEQGYNEKFFFLYWNVALEHTARRELPRLPDVVRELDQWKQDHQFRDPNLAASLHLTAAVYMSPQGAEPIRQYAAAGLEYGPQDDDLRNKLNVLIERADSFDTLGSGAGFAVAEPGLILTNFHVVDGAAALEARIEGVAGNVPGKVVATDPQHDLALIQLEVADPDLLKPLQLSTRSIGRGVAVGAYGYPLEESLGRGLKVVTGVVSATHEQTETGMMLLDCRVNPGNSGGPLCIATGEVVGIVTAKSLPGRNEESFGMAVPAESIVKFLRQHLPDYEPPPADSVGSGPAGFDEVDRQIGPSVVMLLAKRASAAADKSPELQAAEWVLALGGTVGLELADGSRFGIRDAENLPHSQFHVAGIDLQGNNSVTDEGLAHLAQLQALVALGLNGTKISDAGLRHLTNVSTLRLLDVGDTAVTESGLAAVRAALPGCEIHQ